MTRGKMKAALFLMIMAFIVASLFLLSSTDLILKENPTRVYDISVLLPDTDSGPWEMFRKGLDEGAAAWNADISLVTLYESRDAASEQREMIERSLSGGASALIAVPADPEDLADCVRSLPPGKIPVVTAMLPVRDTMQISYDWEGAATLMALSLEAQMPQPVEVIMVCSADTAFQPRFSYMAEKFSAATAPKDSFKRGELKAGGANVEADWVAALPPNTVILAPESSVLVRLSIAKQATNRVDLKLFGIGGNSETLDCLETGGVNVLLVADEQQLGYLCIDAAVRAVRGEAFEDVTMPFRLITPDNMFEEENAHLLFPMT